MDARCESHGYTRTLYEYLLESADLHGGEVYVKCDKCGARFGISELKKEFDAHPNADRISIWPSTQVEMK